MKYYGIPLTDTELSVLNVMAGVVASREKPKWGDRVSPSDIHDKIPMLSDKQVTDCLFGLREKGITQVKTTMHSYTFNLRVSDNRILEEN